MDRKSILKAIKLGEGVRTEFKTSFSGIERIAEIASSFANTKGGQILIGVSDDKRIVGLDVGRQTIERLTDIIVDNTDPKIYPEVTAVKINNKHIIVVKVEESDDKPHLAFGRAFVRIGKSTKPMSRAEHERMLHKKKKASFDSEICESASLKDIDWKFAREEFMPLYENVSERKIVGMPQSLLESLGCIKDKKPTNAGILLFGKNPQKYFMNAYIALARYKGEEEDIERLDYKEIDGNLFQQIDNCDKYIKDHIAIMSRLLPYQIQRQDIPEYGFFTIRELVTNAVCHRDYKNQHTKIIIKMFSKAIEFYNPGGLPENITPKNITEKQFSRNAVISKVLAKVKYIEELGEGWNKIIREHKTHPLKPKMPKIKSDRYTSLINIYSTRDKFEKLKPEKAKPPLEELPQRQKSAIEYLIKNKRLRTKEYREIFKVEKDTAVRDLNVLIKRGFVKRVGKGLSTYYILK